MDALLHQVFSGLATGCIYGSIGLALVMIYQATHHINFAQGEIATFSTFIAWSLLQKGWPYWVAFVVTVALSFAGGLAIQRLIVRPVERAPVLTNVIVFALWFWEGDRGGPAARADADKPHPDFLFPQMQSPELASRDWEPTFLDYFYVAFTNATAFSPTDTMPLSAWAKLLMLTESVISLVTVLLVVARAVNVIGG